MPSVQVSPLVGTLTAPYPDGVSFECYGTVTVNGTNDVTVAHPNYRPGDIVLFGLRTKGGTPATPFLTTCSDGSFTVRSVSGNTSTYIYVAFTPTYQEGSAPVDAIPGEESIVQLELPAAVWMGDSITFASGQQSIADISNYFAGGKLVPVVGYNQGVSGNTTADMLARQATGLALSPKIYFFLGGTNDLTDGLSFATISGNIQTMMTNAFAAGVELFVIRTILPRSAPNALDAGKEATRQAVNAWIMAINDPRVLSINYELSGFDPTLGVDTVDGLHPNVTGAYKLGKYTGNAITSYLTGDPLADTTGNLIPNPTMTGTGGTITSGSGGTVSGVTANGWQGRNFINGVNVAYSKGVDTSGNITQIMTATGLAAANGFFQLRYVSIPYSGQAGEAYEAIVSVDVAGGNTGFVTMFLLTDGVLNFLGSSVALPYNESMSGVVRNGRTTLAAPDASNDFTISFYVNSGSNVNITVTLKQPIWRLVS